MQVFKLVKPGYVDRLIAFDELPADLLVGVKRGPCAGYPRNWKELLGVDPKEKNAFPFYNLDYISVNSDKEKWQAIVSFVKRTVDPKVRMLDKVEDMAKPVAQDSYSDLTLEPEDVPIIPLPKEDGQSPTVEKAEPEMKIRRVRKSKVEEAAPVA